MKIVLNSEAPAARSVNRVADGRAAALVVLHAAVLTPRIRAVQLRALPASWQEILAQPTAPDVYSDVLPGVLQRYDAPDLVRVLGQRIKRM